MTEEQQMWTYERFTPGHVFGVVDIALGPDRRAEWEQVFGATTGPVPRGMLVTAMMQAYIDAIQPRPKGNIHAAQDLSFTDLRLEWGDTISIEVSCVEKETRKGRHWVQFGIRATRNDDLAMTGAIRSIWAA